MKRSPVSHSYRRASQRLARPDRTDGRHAPGARDRLARSRARTPTPLATVVLDLPDKPTLTAREVDAVEQHAAEWLDAFLK